MRVVTFTRTEDGFAQSGEPTFEFGRFQFLKDGKWDGGWCIEPVADLVKRMQHAGPYVYDSYRIIEDKKPELVINPTCAGCGSIAGIDCQHSCADIFGRAEVTEEPPITFNENHQFLLTIKTATKGKHFSKEKLKPFWFNSVRCAELFLTERGLVKVSDEPYGNGARLVRYLDGEVVTKARKRRSPNRSYLGRLASRFSGLRGTENKGLELT